MLNNKEFLFIEVFIVFVTTLSGLVYAEMPPSPTMEELCQQTKLVVCVEPIKESGRTYDIGETHGRCTVKYHIITFKVHKIYKGNRNIKEIDVLIPKSFETLCYASDFLFPNYEKEQRYFLFLKKRFLSKRYIRIGIDDYLGERKWDADKEQAVIEKIELQFDPE